MCGLTLSAKRKSLQAQLDHLSATVQKLQQNYSELQVKTDASVAQSPENSLSNDAHQVAPNSVQKATAVQRSESSPVKPARYADMFRTKNENGEWFVVQPKTSKVPEPPRRIVGGDATSTGLKAVVTNKEPQKWHVFVGRLDPDTSEEDLEQFVSSHNITVCGCAMLERKLEWHKKYAAFHLSIDAKDKDNIFDLVKWPVGCDVRDWVFRTK